ncbi:MAG: hypothetical protein IPG77_02650 [Betaproteobacteria bacterium]|jgi:hypothetical protein|nr:hypothetical protein [Betaproteobacteria bacterium]
MRTTINLAEDALIAARNIAQRERISLGEAVSELIRRGSAAGEPGASASQALALRGRFALLPARDEIVTPQHVRELMDREDL